MFFSESKGYIGKQFEKGFIGQTSTENVFLILSIEEGVTEAEGQKLIESLQTSLTSTTITSLATFESALSEAILKNNFPAHCSLAAGMLYEDVLYVKTVGSGQIFYRRGNDFALLMAGDKSASGYVKEYDCVIFTTTAIKNVIGDAPDIKLFIDMNAPKDIVEKLNIEEYDEEARGFIALFTEFTSQPPVAAVSNVSIPTDVQSPVALAQSPALPATPPPTPMQDPFSTEPQPKRSRFPKINLKGSKKIAFILAIVLLGILVWSVVFGYQRRAAALLDEKIKTTASSIDTKLDKASKEAFLDLDTSIELISQAKEEFADLKKTVGEGHESELTAIEKKITDTESTVTKKENKDSTEFYDLTLEDKSAKGAAVYLEKDAVAILDPGRETVYVLDLEKKSIDKYKSAEVSSATLVATYNGTVFFFSPKKGIYQFTSGTKAKNVVEADSDWGTIVDFKIYNGNLYVLDRGNNQIYKYLVASNGYSNKSSYLSSGSEDLGDATGMAIDSSIYVADGAVLKKYTRGVADTFKTEFPDTKHSLSGVYTDESIDQVYTWDRSNGRVYVLEKEGTYIRQLDSSVIAKSSGVFVYGDSLFALVDSKIFAISLK